VPLSRLRVAGPVTLALIVAGCGSTHSRDGRPGDAAQVRRTVEMALSDLAHADGAAFCALATRAGQAQLARTLPGYSCAKLIKFVGDHLSQPARTGLLHARVGRVTISGSTAEVSAADITASQGSIKGFLNDGGKPTRLIRQPDGSWKID
jgi:hypothetical protein